MRTIRIGKNLTQDINQMCEHYIDDTDGSLTQDYEELRDITRFNNRFRLVVTREERIPQCHDLIINILVDHILNIVDCDEDDTEEMNAFVSYVSDTYMRPGYFDGDDYLLKATTTEALEYIVRWVITQVGGDA